MSKSGRRLALTRVATIGATAALALGTLVGCGTEVDVGDGSVSITDDQGNEFAAGGSTEIPQSWPPEVPLYPDGELVLVTSQSDGTATALWETTASVDEAAATYDDVITAQGFAVEQDATIAGAIVRTYASSLHTVNMTVARTADTTSVNLAVVPK